MRRNLKDNSAGHQIAGHAQSPQIALNFPALPSKCVAHDDRKGAVPTTCKKKFQPHAFEYVVCCWLRAKDAQEIPKLTEQTPCDDEYCAELLSVDTW